MNYQALYREWRPQTFSEVAGQPHIVRTLQNMLRQGRINHAFLFCGPRGTGKTTLAKLLAKALNCQAGPTAEPCLTCPACRAVKTGGFLDVLEIDGASNRGIDEIRDLRERVKYAPAEGRYKVYIIDEVHMLTTEAFNALLKTLEEPPAHVVFIFATTEVHKVPATILSRCQRFDFRRFSPAAIESRLAEVAAGAGITAEKQALKLLAEAANGGMRDALAMLDQVYSYAGGSTITAADVEEVVGLVPGKEYIGILTSLGAGDIRQAFLSVSNLLDAGKEVPQLVSGFIGFCRDLLLSMSDCSGQTREQFKSLEGLFTPNRVLRLIDELIKVEKELRFASEPKILLELAMFRYLNPAMAEQQRLADGAFGDDSGQAGVCATQSTPIATKPGLPAGAAQESAEAEVRTEVPDKLTLHTLQKQWPGVMQTLMAQEPAVAIKLSSARVIGLADGVVALQFDKRFSKNFIEKPDNMQVLTSFLSRHFHQELRLQCELKEEEPAGEPEKIREDSSVNPIEVALSLFEGEEVDPDTIGGPKRE